MRANGAGRSWWALARGRPPASPAGQPRCA